MAKEYVVAFDDGSFIGWSLWYVWEYPDAKLFSNKQVAEEAARKYNKPYTVTPTEEYQAS
jgi:hypothetical protein